MAKGGNHIVAKGDNPVWPRGSKPRGFSKCLGYKEVVYSSNEYVLPSGDRLDVYLELSDGTHVCIEVKPSISPEQEINRGIFQCVKYYAIMEAQRTIEGADYAIEVLLVTTGKFSKLNMTLANELCIDYADAIKINS